MAQAELLSIVSLSSPVRLTYADGQQRPYLTGTSDLFDLALLSVCTLRIWSRALNATLSSITSIYQSPYLSRP